MRSRCFAHALVMGVAAVSWGVTLWLVWAHPTANDPARLPFFVVLGVAIGASSLAAFPWVMQGIVKDVVLAYVAGYHQRASEEEAQRPRLEVVR